VNLTSFLSSGAGFFCFSQTQVEW